MIESLVQEGCYPSFVLGVALGVLMVICFFCFYKLRR